MSLRIWLFRILSENPVERIYLRISWSLVIFNVVFGVVVQAAPTLIPMNLISTANELTIVIMIGATSVYAYSLKLAFWRILLHAYLVLIPFGHWINFVFLRYENFTGSSKGAQRSGDA